MHRTVEIYAYERKTELGGGFRGRVRYADLPWWRAHGLVLNCTPNDTIRESEILPTYENARDWAIAEANKMMGDTPYRRSSVNAKTAGRRYRAFIYAA